jgi:hypothetical protein
VIAQFAGFNLAMSGIRYDELVFLRSLLLRIA